MSATLQKACYENTTAVYMMLELSNKQWKVLIGDGHHHRHKTVVAGDIASLLEQIALFRSKWCVSSEAPVYSCYEAGRDGFWLHRCMLSHGRQTSQVTSVEFASVLLASVLLLVATAICVILFENLGFGSILGFMVAGVIIGPHTPGPENKW